MLLTSEFLDIACQCAVNSFFTFNLIEYCLGSLRSGISIEWSYVEMVYSFTSTLRNAIYRVIHELVLRELRKYIVIRKKWLDLVQVSCLLFCIVKRLWIRCGQGSEYLIAWAAERVDRGIVWAWISTCFFQLCSRRCGSGSSFELLSYILGSSSGGWRGMHAYYSDPQ